MDSLKQGANYVSETVKQATSGASKETNKQVAKDSDAPIGTRYEHPRIVVVSTCKLTGVVLLLPRTPLVTRSTSTSTMLKLRLTSSRSRLVLRDEKCREQMLFAE